MEYTEFLNLIQEAEDTGQQSPEQVQEVADNISNLITSAGISLSDNIKAALNNAVTILKDEKTEEGTVTSDLDKDSNDNNTESEESQPGNDDVKQAASTGKQEVQS